MVFIKMRTLVLVFFACLCFSQNQKKVRLNVNIIGSGIVTHSSGVYPAGESIIIKPIGINREVFSHWSGQLEGLEVKGNELALTMNHSRSITANFKKKGQLTFTFEPFIGINNESGIGIYQKANIVLWKLNSFVPVAEGHRLRLDGKNTGTFFIKKNTKMKKNWIEQYRVRVVTDINGLRESKDFWVDKNKNFSSKTKASLEGYNFQGWFSNDKLLFENLNYVLKIDKPIILVRKFIKNLVSLKINSKLGSIRGEGTYNAGEEVSWSLDETIIHDKSDINVRYQADKEEGSFPLFRDTIININWNKYYRVSILDNDNVHVFRSNRKHLDWAKENSELVFFAEPSEGIRFLGWDVDGEIYKENPLRLKVNKTYKVRALSHAEKIQLPIPGSKETISLNLGKLNTLANKKILNKLKRKKVTLKLKGINPLVQEYFCDISETYFEGRKAVKLTNRYLDFMFSPEDVKILYFARSKYFSFNRFLLKNRPDFYFNLGKNKEDKWKFLYSKNTSYGTRFFYKISNEVYTVISFELKEKNLLVSTEYIQGKLDWKQPNFILDFKVNDNLNQKIINGLQVAYKGKDFSRKFFFGSLNTLLSGENLLFNLSVNNSPYVLGLRSDNLDINFTNGTFRLKVLDGFSEKSKDKDFNILLKETKELNFKLMGVLSNKLYIKQKFILQAQ